MTIPESNTRAADAIVFWNAISSGDYTAWERHVRRDQRRLDVRELQELVKDLGWLLTKFDGLAPQELLERSETTMRLIRRLGASLADAANQLKEAS